jgi:ATP-binding cassette, subfamily C, bacterial LapB
MMPLLRCRTKISAVLLSNTPERKGSSVSKDPIEASVLWILSYYGRGMSAAALNAQTARQLGRWTIDQGIEALESFGIRVAPTPLDGGEVLEPILVLHKEEAHIFIPPVQNGMIMHLQAAHDDRPELVPIATLRAMQGSTAVSFTAPLRANTSSDGSATGRYGHWFWGPLLQARSVYGRVFIAAILTNVFALSASMFSMLVYDRVMPNGAVETLMALLTGMVIIWVSDFAIRTLRSYFLDIAGAQADMIIADSLFEQVLDMRLGARKGSIGSISSIIREFESLREFLTSSSLTILIDIPFALLFLVVVGLVGGPLVFVPLLVAPFVILASVVIQPALKRLTSEVQADNQTKNATLVEALAGIETVKALGAGSIMRRRWQDAVTHQSAISLKTRMLSQFAANVANLASQVVWVGVVTYGFFLVQAGQIGTGAIVASSMLAGRVISPLAQLAGLMVRINQSLVSYRSLNEIMSAPREHGPRDVLIDTGPLKGAIEFRNVSFDYPGQRKGGLKNVSFSIKPGEKVAFVGPIGSGKSTLTRLMLGLYPPQEGAILFDGTDSRQIDPAALRENIGVVMQDVWLASGSVKENIALGARHPTDEEIIEASRIAGVHDFVSSHPDGYALRLRERGDGISGGQRQAISLARALVNRGAMLILDEPTSAADVTSERHLIERLRQHAANKTVILITHRPSMLALVDRILVIQNGQVIADGPRDEVLRRFSQPGDKLK